MCESPPNICWDTSSTIICIVSLYSPLLSKVITSPQTLVPECNTTFEGQFLRAFDRLECLTFLRRRNIRYSSIFLMHKCIGNHQVVMENISKDKLATSFRSSSKRKIITFYPLPNIKNNHHALVDEFACFYTTTYNHNSEHKSWFNRY